MQLKIKFAPLIRVSTERQEKKGESLNTQKKQIIDYVDSLDGIIPDVCWQYTGQEHATPDQERKILDKLLTDSGKGFFDAVIVCDASRWSRDNGKNDEGLKILIKN
ncbi:recombinase family protein, partial [bacterium]|nr:recombinase family protein [bacterium]